MKIYLLITIDTECDKGPEWKIQKPLQFKSITYGIPNILTPLFNAFELKPTYLLSPEVLTDEECVKVLSKCENAELGTHLHGEFINPEANWNTDNTRTPQSAYPPIVEKAKLENLTNLFTKKFGYRPTSFRAGRWGISRYTLHFLEELGYLVDSSVCPFRTHYFPSGNHANFWGSILQPYHPSRHDYRTQGTMKILEMPATLGNAFYIGLPYSITRMFSDKSLLHKRILKKVGINTSITWLRPYRSNANDMENLTKIYINKFRRNEVVFLNMMFHSNEIIPGASPYVQTHDELFFFLNNMKTYFDKIKTNYEVEGITLSDIPKII